MDKSVRDAAISAKNELKALGIAGAMLEEQERTLDKIAQAAKKAYEGQGAQSALLYRELLKAEEAYAHAFRKVLQDRMKAEAAIAQVGQPFSRLLYLHYFQRKSLDETANILGYCYTYTSELHGEAVRRYADVRRAMEQQSGWGTRLVLMDMSEGK